MATSAAKTAARLNKQLMLDAKFTKKLQEWLNAPKEEKSLHEGAELLLRLNRNRWLYQQILRRKLWSKLEYELGKHLRIRQDGMSRDDVARMEIHVMSRVKKSVAKFRGKRPDHDTLPEKIQKLYEDNGVRFEKMKQAYNDLLGMMQAEPRDRYELLKCLGELEEKYRDVWAEYDAYKAVPGTDDEVVVTAPTAAKVSAARKFLSTNAPKLRAAVEAGDSEKADALRQKMSERVALILSAGEGFKAESRQQLAELGLTT